MLEEERGHKYRVQNGETPSFKAYHEVHITKYSGSLNNEEITAFIDNNISDFKGHVEENHGIPVMLFDREQDARAFADELTAKLKIKKEHIAIKARKFTR